MIAYNDPRPMPSFSPIVVQTIDCSRGSCMNLSMYDDTGSFIVPSLSLKICGYCLPYLCLNMAEGATFTHEHLHISWASRRSAHLHIQDILLEVI